MELKFANYGQERDVNATPEEYQIAGIILGEFPDESLRLVRVSDGYVTIKRNDWDIVRFKYTDRAKWLMFPIIETRKKHRIEDVSEVEDFFAAVADSINHAKKYD